MMNTKSFAKKIKELSNNNRWMVLLVSYLISMIVSTSEEIEFVSLTMAGEFVTYLVDYGVSVLICIFCCVSFYDKHLKFSTRFVKEDVFMGDSIVHYMKYHGFPVEEYFLYIMKSFIPIQTVMAVWAIIIAINSQRPTKAIAGIAVFVIPFIVWKLRKAMFNYSATHREIVWLSLVKAFFGTIIWIISIILVEMTFVFGVIAVYAVVESMIIPLNDNIAAVCINEGAFMWMFAIAVAIWPIILYTDEKILKKYHVKAMASIIVLVIVSLNLYSNIGNRIIIDEETISEIKDFKESTYYFNDVKKFEVSEAVNAEDIAMKFYFNDGEAISVTMANYSSTEKWDYDNQYEYIKHIATQLSDSGVECSVIEPDKLLEDLKDYWSEEDYENVKQIVELLSE